MTVRFDVEVSLAFGADLSADPATWSWTDITDYCMVREGGVWIQRGRRDWQATTTPAVCELLVNNADGRFSRLNPSGAWYSQLGKNTPLRIRACAAGGALTTRFVGFIAELPPQWDPSESHYWVKIAAAGVLRRLGLRSTPLRSSVARVFAALSPLRYWPMEDGSAAESFAEFGGGPPMTFFGDLTLAGESPDGSAPLPTLSATTGLQATIGAESDTGTWTAVGVFNMPASPAAATAVMRWYTTGSLPIWQVVITPGSPDTIALQAYDAGGTLRINASMNFTSILAAELTDTWVAIVAEAAQNGGDVDASLTVIETDTSTATTTDSETGYVTGTLASFAVNPSAGIEGLSLGHIGFWNETVSVVAADVARAMTGWTFESASARFLRLCREESVSWYVDIDNQPYTQAMGPRVPAALLEMLRETEAADAAMIAERLTGELGFYSVQDRMNQAVALALDYDASHIKPPFDPADDDAQVVNDVTITRTTGSNGARGSSGRAQQVTGPLGTDPETGIGRYELAATLNLYQDSQTLHAAGWRLSLGTVDEYRYPQVHLMFHSSSALLTPWLACDLGSRVTIDNMPANMPPDLVDQTVEGYTERISSVEWDAVLNLSPYKPYKVFEFADTTSDASEFVGRHAGDTAAIRAAIDSDDTSILFDPNAFRWTAVADDFDPDLDVRLGGEVVSVSTIATTAATFVAAGTVAHASNANVTPSLPAGVAANDLLLILAAIRNSGTGVPVAPTGYTRLPAFLETSNVQLFAKVHSGSESNPTVTFTGGVANADTSAQMAAFRNMPITLDDLADVVLNAAPQYNTSAQNIPTSYLAAGSYPGCVVLALAWKQDDWTSVTSPSGFTEIGEPDTTTGDDQGITWAYRIDTTPTLVAAGSFTVTGGGSAISRSSVVSLAGGFQTMTVSARSVNGLTKSHAAGTRIDAEQAYVLGL
jgi:hypothetical protein